MISVFDIFKIGIGPSSSHTVGPMRAAGRFVASLSKRHLVAHVSRVETILFGSLAWTGHGHATDVAVILGLAGEEPETIEPDIVPGLIASAAAERMLSLGGRRAIAFDRAGDIVFDRKTPPPGHPNTLSFTAFDERGQPLLTEVYHSVGGGFVVAEGEATATATTVEVPCPFRSGDDLLRLGRRHGLTIGGIVMANETARLPEAAMRDGLMRIRSVMDAAIERGTAPGRRAAGWPAGQAARQGAPRAPAGRSQPQHPRAARDDGLGIALCHRGE